VQFHDEQNSEQEDRFLMLGLSNEMRIVLVCHCEHGSDEKIRIISARKATKTERTFYKGGPL
jgi:hypothetical protein